MRVDFDQVINNLMGQPLKMGADTVTLKFAAITALLNTFPGDENLGGEEKARRYRLAKAIGAGMNRLDPGQAELIKKLVGRTFGPPVVGPVYDALLEEAGAEPLERAIEETMAERAEAGLDQPPTGKKGRA